MPDDPDLLRRIAISIKKNKVTARQLMLAKAMTFDDGSKGRQFYEGCARYVGAVEESFWK